MVGQRWGRVGALTAFISVAVGVILQLRHSGQHEAHEINPLIHGARDVGMSLPLFLMAVVVGLTLANAFIRRGRLMHTFAADLSQVTGVTIAISLSLVPGSLGHGGLFATEGADLAHALVEALAMVPYTFVAVLVAISVIRMPSDIGTAELAMDLTDATARLAHLIQRRIVGIDYRRVARAMTAVVVLAGGMAIIPAGTPAGSLAPAGAAVPPVGATCDAGGVDRSYDVSAINVVIPRNRWGDVDLNGQSYALDQDKSAIRHWADPVVGDPSLPENRRLRPRPLVLRANEGECVAIALTNELDIEAPVPAGSPEAYSNVDLPADGLPDDQWVSIHAHGVAYNAQTSGGGQVGFNDDTGIPPGEQQTYYWRVPDDEGAYLFRDVTTLAGSEADGGAIGHGLYGVLAVEPAGSQWFDAVSGLRLDGDHPYENVANQSGELYLDAIIVPPAAQSGDYAINSTNLPVRAEDSVAFRETMQISQDEMPGQHLQNCDLSAADEGRMIDGRPDRSECTTTETVTPNSMDFSIGLGFNYGEEHLLVRAHPINRCPDCVGEETWLSSWPYGDPALVKLGSGFGPWYPQWHPWYDGGSDGIGANQGQSDGDNVDDPEDCGVVGGCFTANVPHAYQYDAQKVRFIHAGPKETHVFHMHAHQWLADAQDVGQSGATPGVPDDNQLPESSTLDSQSYGPGESFTADLFFGAGSRPGTVGDSIFHCHLYPHFAEGFWSLFRTHDVFEDGSGVTPDGIGVRMVVPLPDRSDLPDLPVASDPGFPRFIPGEVGWRAPQPILGVYDNNGTPDDPATIDREDLDPAIRQVAGVGLEEPSQEVTVPAAAAGGDFTLTLGADTTAAIAWNAPPEDVESALELLAGIVDATVTGGGGSGLPYVVEFAQLELDLATPAATVLLSSDGTGLSPPGTSIRISAPWADGAADESRATDLAYRLSLERAATLESHNDGIYDDASGNNEPLPGAPLVDPCLPGSRQITYNVSLIQLDILHNDAGWHDTQGRVLVLDKDVDGVLEGTKPLEPFFFRANPNDCVNFNLTNRTPNWFGNDDFLQMIQTNMIGQHIHLVKFDVNGSDGSSNGWNYQQAAFSEAQKLYNDSILTGDPIAEHPDLSHLPDDAVAECAPDEFDNASLVSGGCRIPMPSYVNPQWTCQAAGGCPVGQTIRERWYVDYDLRTIFTHEHHFPAEDQNRGLFGALVVEPTGMDTRSPVTGEYFQPINDPAHGEVCGDECIGAAVGTRVDMIGPGPSDDFREFALAIEDFVSLYRPCEDDCDSSVISGEEPVAAPEGGPELYPTDDPGIMGVNYRTEPFVLRQNGADPAYVFSSTVHGDPATPLLQAYAGDAIRARVIQGSMEEQHVLQIHGMRWLDEPDDPESSLIGAKTIGISEAFNFVIPEIRCGSQEGCFGDYLYGGTSTDDMWTGMWGLLRVFAKQVDGLLPLPDNFTPGIAKDVEINDTVTGEAPAPPRFPGKPCPAGAQARDYHVIALDTPIIYDEQAGQYDPYGLVYAEVGHKESPAEAAARVRASNPEPMVLRANEGDCINVTLTNMIDPEGAFAVEHAPVGAGQAGNGFDAPLVIESAAGTPAGLRVSLHAALVDYDILGSDGATVGFNPDQTVGPRSLSDPVGTEGESITYRWYAAPVSPGELGAINLTDYGDVRGHRHHGLFGGLIIEPEGATWTDPYTGEPATSAQADIHVDGEDDFREFVTFYQDGVNLWDEDGNLPDPKEHADPEAAGHEDGADGEVAHPEEVGGALPDAEDRGEKALNYRTASFQPRLDLDPGEPLDDLDGEDLAHVFSSDIHGDPDTPVFRALSGDNVVWRVLQGADKPRQHSFQVGGHSWFRQINESDAEAETIGVQGGLSVGRSVDINITAGEVGDYRYGDAVLDNKLSGGWWGVFRVYDSDDADPDGAPISDPDNPHTGTTPLMPLSVEEDEPPSTSSSSSSTSTTTTAASTTSTAASTVSTPPSTPPSPSVTAAPLPKKPDPVKTKTKVLPTVQVASPASAVVGNPSFVG